MKIESLAEYENAVRELADLERAQKGPAARRREELEAAVAAFAEQERSDPELERGRPPGKQAPKEGQGQRQGKAGQRSIRGTDR